MYVSKYCGEFILVTTGTVTIIWTRKNVKYIDYGNIDLGMSNRSKLHLNRFGTFQLVKNYREIWTWHHKEKPANESVPNPLVLVLLTKL